MQARIQLVTILGSAVLLLTVLEMVRRRRLLERYALLWLLSAVVLLALAIWSNALAKISHAIGVIYPPNALFFIAIGFILLLLLHFSSAVSRLGHQSEMLAQQQALLDERLQRQERQTDDSGATTVDGTAELEMDGARPGTSRLPSPRGPQDGLQRQLDTRG
jgi:hypothetical protein